MQMFCSSSFTCTVMISISFVELKWRKTFDWVFLFLLFFCNVFPVFVFVLVNVLAISVVVVIVVIVVVINFKTPQIP